VSRLERNLLALVGAAVVVLVMWLAAWALCAIVPWGCYRH
jgi:hypothetical protein